MRSGLGYSPPAPDSQRRHATAVRQPAGSWSSRIPVGSDYESVAQIGEPAGSQGGGTGCHFGVLKRERERERNVWRRTSFDTHKPTINKPQISRILDSVANRILLAPCSPPPVSFFISFFFLVPFFSSFVVEPNPVAFVLLLIFPFLVGSSSSSSSSVVVVGCASRMEG